MKCLVHKTVCQLHIFILFYSFSPLFKRFGVFHTLCEFLASAILPAARGRGWTEDAQNMEGGNVGFSANYRHRLLLLYFIIFFSDFKGNGHGRNLRFLQIIVKHEYNLFISNYILM